MAIKLNSKILHWVAVLLLTFLLLPPLTSLVINNAAKLLVGVIEDHAIPYALKTDDVEMGCVMAETFTLFIPGLAQINASPYKLAVIFGFLSGSCSEFKAEEEELRYLRAIHEKNITEAQDARILQKRYLNLAAQRQLKGYLNLALAYPETADNECPDFNSWSEEFYWLVGLMNGLQAVLNDLVSEGNANVPLDISLKVGRSANCLDNEKWWGLPHAIQAAIWVCFPGNKPKGIDPLAVLDLSVKTGLKQGVRIVQVIAAKIYIGLGDSKRVKAIIRNNAEIGSRIPANADYLFLDKVASIQLLAISDGMWTKVTGKRTPVGEFGSFWDDPENTVDTVDIIDIL